MAYTSPNRTWIALETVTAAVMNQYIKDQLDALCPVGHYDFFALESAGEGVENLINGAWLEANGASVLRATYPYWDAHAAARTPVRPWGAADGTHVAVPNFFGRSFWMVGQQAEINALGKTDNKPKADRGAVHGTSGGAGGGSGSISGSASGPMPQHQHDDTITYVDLGHDHVLREGAQDGGVRTPTGWSSRNVEGTFDTQALELGYANLQKSGGVGNIKGAAPTITLPVSGTVNLGALTVGPQGRSGLVADAPGFAVGGIIAVKVKP